MVNAIYNSQCMMLSGLARNAFIEPLIYLGVYVSRQGKVNDGSYYKTAPEAFRQEWNLVGGMSERKD